MRIILMTEWFLPSTGGVETHVYELAHWLIKRGHDVCLLTDPATAGQNKRKRHPFKIIGWNIPDQPMKRNLHILKGFLSRYFVACMELAYLNAPLIRKLRPDIIHSHSIDAYTIAAILGSMTGVPVVATFHLNHLGTLFSKCKLTCDNYKGRACLKCRLNFPWLKNQSDRQHIMGLRRLFLRSCMRIITPARTDAEYIRKTHGLKNTRHLSNWVDAKRFSVRQKDVRLMRKYGLEKNNPVILYMGRVYYLKGIEFLIRALPSLLGRYPSAKVLIAGRTHTYPRDPYPGHIRKIFRELGLQDHIIFTGSLPYEEIPALYALADVLVHPSLAESQGLVLLEAMAAGVPVIVSDLEQVRNFIRNGSNGILIPVKSSGAIAKAVGDVLDDTPLRRNLIRNGKETIRQKFSMQRLLPEPETLYGASIREFRLKNRMNKWIN